MTRVAVTGATGRMGQTVLATAEDRDDVTVDVAVNRDPHTDSVAGHRIHPAADLPGLLADHAPDAVIDFTGPSSAVEYADTSASAGVAFVSGTTGLDGTQRRRFRTAADEVPVLHAPNFAPGVAVLRDLVAAAVSSLSAYDVEVVEAHHRNKRDAPSGTALDLVSVVEDAGGGDRRTQYGRRGECPREEGEVGVHSLRGGSITGEHTVVLAGPGESIRLEHRAGDREAFAAGALDAAVWVADRPPGSYGMADVTGGGS